MFRYILLLGLLCVLMPTVAAQAEDIETAANESDADAEMPSSDNVSDANTGPDSEMTESDTLAGGTPVDTADEEAKAFFDKGTVLYEAGEYEKAANAFRDANRIKPNWKLYFNIGQCEALAKRHGMALEAFAAYLSGGGDDIPLTRQAEIRTEIVRLKEMTGYLQIAAPEGAEIVIDGVHRGVSPLAGQIPVSAGVRHNVSIIERESDTPKTMAVMVVSGKTAQMNFMPELPSEVAPSQKTVPDPTSVHPLPAQIVRSPSGYKFFGIASLFTAGAVFIAGGITGIASVRNYNKLEDRCPNKLCTSESNSALQDKVDALTLSTDILLPVGGALVVLGAVLLAVDKSRSKKKQSAAFFPQQNGFLFEGSF
ncbi:MAG: tetratricopeptide repeat protein [Deltaproteobacteria bacterium]|nr:tetratricopeptide repeat protein [Deltaproteobacteria bacterium]